MEFSENILAKEKLEKEKINLVGNSLGGGIAQIIASKHPEQVNAIVLIDSVAPIRGLITPWIFFLVCAPGYHTLLRNYTSRGFVSEIMREVTVGSVIANPLSLLQLLQWNDVKQRYLDLTVREGNRDVILERARQNSLEKLPAHLEERTKQLQSLSTPTLILWGKRDNWIPVEVAYQLQQLIPSSTPTKVIVYDELGHIPQEDAPQLTVSDTLKFLSTLKK